MNLCLHTLTLAISPIHKAHPIKLLQLREAIWLLVNSYRVAKLLVLYSVGYLRFMKWPHYLSLSVSYQKSRDGILYTHQRYLSYGPIASCGHIYLLQPSLNHKTLRSTDLVSDICYVKLRAMVPIAHPRVLGSRVHRQ